MSTRVNVFDYAADDASQPTSKRTGGWIRRVSQRLIDERAAAQLRALDDRMLRDIGLTRADIPAKPWWFPAG